jgi:hypothetical protein
VIKDFSHCQHDTERKVFEFLTRSLPETTDIVVFPNIELFDTSKASYVECDAIVLTKSFIAVIERSRYKSLNGGVVVVSSTVRTLSITENVKFSKVTYNMCSAELLITSCRSYNR